MRACAGLAGTVSTALLGPHIPGRWFNEVDTGWEPGPSSGTEAAGNGHALPLDNLAALAAGIVALARI